MGMPWNRADGRAPRTLLWTCSRWHVVGVTVVLRLSSRSTRSSRTIRNGTIGVNVCVLAQLLTLNYADACVRQGRFMSVGLSAIAITTRWTLLSIACRQTGHFQVIHSTPHRVSVVKLSSYQTNSPPSTVTQTNELQW